MSRFSALVLGVPARLGARHIRSCPYAKLLHVRVPMRDNVRLDTNVFRPRRRAAASPRF